MLLFVGVLCIFILAENLFSESQINKQTENWKITLELKIALGVQKKRGLLEQQTESFNCNRVALFAAR